MKEELNDGVLQSHTKTVHKELDRISKILCENQSKIEMHEYHIKDHEHRILNLEKQTNIYFNDYYATDDEKYKQS